MIFYCTYKSSEGNTVIENVNALSSWDAKRQILLKHPLAQFVDEPTTKSPTIVAETPGKVIRKNFKGKYWLLIVAVCVVVGVCLLLIGYGMMRGVDNASSTEEANKEITKETSRDSASEYVNAYRNLVSVKTEESTGTGFKVKQGNKVYLYTCLHCIIHDKPIVVRDSLDEELEFEDLELCEGRDIVRFRLPNEHGGFEIATGADIKIGAQVVAYGDTLGTGVMTQNKGHVLAVGSRKIEIDAAVLQGNSGGPVLDSNGKVVGVVSSGSVDNTIWSKDTRYENVRKFAERIDELAWKSIDYEELREVFAYLNDSYVMIQELREFFQKTAGQNFTNRLYRPFVNDRAYKGEFGHVEEIKSIYDTWNKMSDEDKVTQQIVNEMLEVGKKGERLSMVTFNRLDDSVTRFNALLRQALVTKPSSALSAVASELRLVDLACFQKSKQLLIDDIETILLPSIGNYEKFVSDREQNAKEQRKKTYDLIKKAQ